MVLDAQFPTYPEGFPPEVIDAFSAAIGRGAGGVAESQIEGYRAGSSRSTRRRVARRRRGWSGSAVAGGVRSGSRRTSM
jgi:hypothetical protein